MPGNEKHPESKVRALAVNKWVLVPCVDRAALSGHPVWLQQPLIAQQAAI